ncbi:aryl-alcohol dehydrogenase [Streptomyces scabiei]|uniref:NAD(P)-dependent alcohol dehydrogenase n=1 Tax=Streptomyces scabiei TaxID=1930 RepID=UPI0004E6274D|nr:NAD(P)-dependent alcohol dehydrogenase [Streptomyces scabiei]KFF98907.1 aryl-alcohol dehydrogenase [Streptomyces scabiei]
MKITAAVSRESLTVPELEQVDLEDPGPDEVLVRIVATGICHTDINAHSGRGIPVPQPIVLGHEGAGVVEAVGAGVTRLGPGDHVVLSGNSCGVCPSCLNARPTYCREAMHAAFGGARRDGSSPITRAGERVAAMFFGQSSFATYAVAPARSAVLLPKDAPLHLMGPLGCGVVTGAGSVLEAFGLRPGQSIAVFGTGGVGLAAVMAARLAGARHIVAVDIHRHRLDLAMELGATDAVLGDAAAGQALRRIEPEGFDFAYVTADVPSVFATATTCLGVEGTLGYVVAPGGEWVPDTGFLLAGGRRLQGIIGGSANPHVLIPQLIEYWRAGRFPFDRLIEEFAFSDFARAWTETSSGRVIKAVLRMPD